MARLPIALFNFEDGGLQSDGTYDFAKLQRAFADTNETPALIMLCEAKHYDNNGSAGLFAAADALSEELGREYVGELGWCERGPFGPAIFYDPQALKLLSWRGRADCADKHNLAHFRVHDGGKEFLCKVEHWNNRSGTRRLQEAGDIDGYGKHELPVLIGGDLNSTASGPHLPPRDWMAADFRARSHKGRWHPEEGTWSADVAAVDHLIGRWDEVLDRRVDGCGFDAIAEIAWRAGVSGALTPTVNDKVDAGGSQLIDWLLVNRRMAKLVIPDSYYVRVPDDRLAPPSDHRAIFAACDF